MVKKGQEGKDAGGKDDFSRMKRGDVQFTTGGSGMRYPSFVINKAASMEANVSFFMSRHCTL